MCDVYDQWTFHSLYVGDHNNWNYKKYIESLVTF